jgi:hypothetical protein
VADSIVLQASSLGALSCACGRCGFREDRGARQRCSGRGGSGIRPHALFGWGLGALNPETMSPDLKLRGRTRTVPLLGAF